MIRIIEKLLYGHLRPSCTCGRKMYALRRGVPIFVCTCGQLKVGLHTITVGGSTLAWSATGTPTAAGQLGMDVTTGRPLAFVGGTAKDVLVSGDAGGGLTTRVDRYTANGSWSKPANAVWIEAWLIGGGGGGGGGARGINPSGGGGGGGGAVTYWSGRASDWPGSVSVEIGAPGTFGVAAGADNTDGGAAGNGGETRLYDSVVGVSIGTFLRASGGAGGIGGKASGSASDGGSGGSFGIWAGVNGGNGATTTTSAQSSIRPTERLMSAGGGGGGGNPTFNMGGTGAPKPMAYSSSGITGGMGGGTGANGQSGQSLTNTGWAGGSHAGGGGGGGGGNSGGPGGQGGAGGTYGGSNPCLRLN